MYNDHQNILNDQFVVANLRATVYKTSTPLFCLAIISILAALLETTISKSD